MSVRGHRKNSLTEEFTVGTNVIKNYILCCQQLKYTKKHRYTHIQSKRLVNATVLAYGHVTKTRFTVKSRACRTTVYKTFGKFSERTCNCLRKKVEKNRN